VTPAASVSPPTAAAGKMAHCPSAVTSANTVVKDVEGGVLLTVTAKDTANVTDIRQRAKFLADSAKNMAPDVKHNGGGEGGGSFGRCPVVMRNTAIDIKDVEGGSELTVKPKDAKELDWLRREARERLAEIGDPNAKEAGQGKMAHCPSAVGGSTTTVKDLKDGVEVSIVAKDDASTKTIRERAKTVLDAAKLDAQKLVHKGDGSGGGGFGRCPVVLKDTKVESKEIPGGVLFTVKPEKAADLAALKKETAERAHKFAAMSAAAPAAGGAKTETK
jgi:TusA-related sulfurtransferase